MSLRFVPPLPILSFFFLKSGEARLLHLVYVETLCVLLGLENVWCLLDLENFVFCLGTLGVRSTLTTLGVFLASLLKPLYA